MSESETLRPAAPDDAAAVAALTDAAYGKFVPRIGRSPMPMTFDYARVIAEHPIWVIDGTNGPCAVLYLIPRDDHLMIESIAVHPEVQGRGMGRRLMALAADEARRLGVPEIRLYTNVKMTENIAFYQRLGYQEVERRHKDGFDRVYMRLQVAHSG